MTATGWPAVQIEGVVVAPRGPAMDDAAAGGAVDLLRTECEGLCHFLAGCAPTEYVLGKYLEAHNPESGLLAGPGDRLDELLLALAREGGIALAAADAYARLVRPGGVLRRKAILLLAVLESAPPRHDHLNAAVTGRKLSLVLSLAAWGTRGAFTTALGILGIGPAHLALRVRERCARRAAGHP